jgi:hypothetical protein
MDTEQQLAEAKAQLRMMIRARTSATQPQRARPTAREQAHEQMCQELDQRMGLAAPAPAVQRERHRMSFSALGATAKPRAAAGGALGRKPPLPVPMPPTRGAALPSSGASVDTADMDRRMGLASDTDTGHVRTEGSVRIFSVRA